jgi:thiol-disulfide isomerase/thioredoxin
MKTILGLAVLLSVSVVSAYGQLSPRAEQINCFNRFQDVWTQQNSDSALYYVQCLAEQNPGMANELVHNSFAQPFKLPTDSSSQYPLARQLLARMEKSPVSLLRVVMPLQHWVDVSEHLFDTARVRRLVTGLMTMQNRAEETVGNRVDRYAMLVYKLLAPRPEYRSLTDTLLAHTQERLDHATNGRYYQSIHDIRPVMENRAYFRFLNATLAYWQAEAAEQRNDKAAARQFYQRASELGPDENDLLVKAAYFYESIFLMGREIDDFYTPYITFLEKQGTKPDTLLALVTKRTLNEPSTSTIANLRAYYEKAGSAKEPFRQYWQQQLNTSLRTAEPFRLTDLDKTVFDYGQQKGKWILLDFWGTWCKPCVAELPEMQRFYERMKARNDIVLMTVACSDQEPLVRAFMTRNRYAFPVAMADQTIEKQFRVNEYPTKVLITPQGRRMKIPFNTNWVSRVETYLANQ